MSPTPAFTVQRRITLRLCDHCGEGIAVGAWSKHGSNRTTHLACPHPAENPHTTAATLQAAIRVIAHDTGTRLGHGHPVVRALFDLANGANP